MSLGRFGVVVAVAFAFAFAAHSLPSQDGICVVVPKTRVHGASKRQTEIMKKHPSVRFRCESYYTPAARTVTKSMSTAAYCLLTVIVVVRIVNDSNGGHNDGGDGQQAERQQQDTR